MNVKIISVGKLKESYLAEACAEYSKRLGAFCKFSIIEIPEHRLSSRPSEAEIEEGIRREGERIIAAIPPQAYVFALCIEGELISSEQLAQDIESAALSGKSDIVLVIGGSFGLSPELKRFASKRISAGRMTFPHQLFRVMLCEQLYRAFSIINNGKYHK